MPSFVSSVNIMGFPGGSDRKESACNVGDLDLIPGSGRSSWRRKWLPTPVFLPRKFLGQRSLVGCSPWHHKESDTTDLTVTVLRVLSIFTVVYSIPLHQHTTDYLLF